MSTEQDNNLLRSITSRTHVLRIAAWAFLIGGLAVGAMYLQDARFFKASFPSGSGSGDSCHIESQNAVQPATCGGTAFGGLCSTPFYQDITFDEPFENIPNVIVTPDRVSDQGGCVNYETDQIVCRPSSITTDGFRLECSGSPKTDSTCGGIYKSYYSLALASWTAIENNDHIGCEAQSGHGVEPSVCGGTSAAGGLLCSAVFTQPITFAQPFDTVPNVVVTPEKVSSISVSGCVAESTNLVACYAGGVTKTGFNLTCGGAPAAGPGCAYSSYASRAKAGWLAIEEKSACEMESASMIEMDTCLGAQSGSSLCGSFWKTDVVFDEPFEELPTVIITPDFLSSEPACASWRTDSNICQVADLTTTGFIAYCFGNLVGDSCGVGAGWNTKGKFSYIAIDGACSNDTDGDGVADEIDNCPSVSNPDQLNSDGDDNDVDEIGIYRRESYDWYSFNLDINGNTTWEGSPADSVFDSFNNVLGDTALMGDWDGDGDDDLGIQRIAGGLYNYYLDTNDNGLWDGEAVDRLIKTFNNNPGDIGISGDWDGDGIDAIGIYRGGDGRFYLDKNNNGLWDGPIIDIMSSAAYGLSEDLPVIGDWNGDGIDQVGIFRPSHNAFRLDKNTNYIWDGSTIDMQSAAAYGVSGDLPLAGDWDGDGLEQVGVYRNSNGTFYLDANNNLLLDAATVDQHFVFLTGGTLVQPLAGNWASEVLGDACDPDDDNDGIDDEDDNCPVDSNPEQEDTDEDGVGDACDDEASEADTDGDGVDDEDDNCPYLSNPGQEDSDDDGEGDACEGDFDSDGVHNFPDNCPDVPNPDQANNDAFADGIDGFGVYRGQNATFYLDVNDSRVYDGPHADFRSTNFGQDGDQPVYGDWDGDGIDQIGLYRDSLAAYGGLGVFFLDANNNGVWDGPGVDLQSPGFGQPGDQPLAGDWDGDGDDEIGLYRDIGPGGLGLFFLDINHNYAWDGPSVDVQSPGFGKSGDQPLAGDWDGDGDDEIGLYRESLAAYGGLGVFFLDTNHNYTWNGPSVDVQSPAYGNPGDQPLAGDWDGDGDDEIGLYRESDGKFYLDINHNYAWDGPTVDFVSVQFGNPGEQPMAGNWNQDVLGDVCDSDDDNDEVGDDDDNCPLDFNPEQEDTDEDGIGDACDDEASEDADDDGVDDEEDNCPFDANPEQEDADDDGDGDECDIDDDDDGVDDEDDNCPLDSNPEQEDSDEDGVGDACDDGTDEDTDGDGIDDEEDNCPLVANPSQKNTDSDEQGNACDPDDDNDGVSDITDNCSLVANPSQQNTDSDAQGNACDSDDDNDAVPDTTDNCPLDSNEDQTDTDDDGAGDECDDDDDDDGVDDEDDNCPLDSNPEQEDTDEDGIGDACETGGCAGVKGDLNGDGLIRNSDAVLLQSAIIHIATLDTCQTARADVNCSGTITTSDLLQLNDYIVHIIDTFSCTM